MSEILLELTDIEFRYPDAPQVLGGLSLELRGGEKTAIIGANGCGKSTLLHLIVGLIRPQSGVIRAFGQPRESERDFLEVRRRAALLFQESEDQLFCPTVIEDVAFGPLNMGLDPDEARLVAENALERVGMSGFGERTTHHLSVGEKKLVSLATVIAMKPDVFLLDEPTAGLDDKARGRVLELLSGLPDAMLLVSHDRALIESVVSRSLILENGRLNRAD